jgi:hypothetical protein
MGLRREMGNKKNTMSDEQEVTTDTSQQWIQSASNCHSFSCGKPCSSFISLNCGMQTYYPICYRLPVAVEMGSHPTRLTLSKTDKKRRISHASEREQPPTEPQSKFARSGKWKQPFNIWPEGLFVHISLHTRIQELLMIRRLLINMSLHTDNARTTFVLNFVHKHFFTY